MCVAPAAHNLDEIVHFLVVVWPVWVKSDASMDEAFRAPHQATTMHDVPTGLPLTEPKVVGRAPAFLHLLRLLERVALTDRAVLISGPTGSGKDVLAQLIHRRGREPSTPFLDINCGALPEHLVEAELFGYAKGAFTGATSARAGYFEEARDSTLFLDEIGELPLELQAKLLRVLENGEFQRVGETQTRSSNARVVAATNRDLRQEVRAGRFRADLYHRMSVFAIDVPPLRDLGDDRLLLLDHFRHFYAQQSGAAPFELNARALTEWMEYGFPGNVRELRNIVIRLTTKYAGQPVDAAQLRAELDTESLETASGGALPDSDAALTDAAKRQLQTERGFNLDETLARWERVYVDAALEITQGNLTRAAKMLGMNRTTLYSRMQNHAGPHPDDTKNNK